MFGCARLLKKCGVFLPLVFVIFCLRGQTPAYLHYDVSDGLPGNIVYCAAQDERGFMWFGTDKGLACFDGTRFRVFGMKDGLPDPEVLNLKLDSKGRMWIFCFKQKPCYRYRGRIFTEKEDNMLNSADFNFGAYQFSEQNSDSLWFFGGNRKAFLLKGESFTAFTIQESAFSIMKIKGATYALSKSFFYILDSTGSFQKIAHIGFNDAEATISGVIQKGNNVLVSIGNGLYEYEVIGKRVTKVREKKHLSGTLFIDHLSRYWVCSTKYGAICFDNDKGNLSHPITFLKGKKVTCMFEDTHRTLWFCTAGEGVFSLPQSASQIYTDSDGLFSNNITAVGARESGRVIAGDDQGIIYEVGGKVSEIMNLGNGYLNRSRQLFSDSSGNIYAVTDFGVSVMKGKRIQKILDSRSAKCLLITNEGLLIGTSTQLELIEKPFLNKKTLFSRRTTTLLRDSEGFIWLGGIDGIYCSSDSFKKNFADEFSLLKSRIIALEKGGQNGFWAATPQYGVLSIKSTLGKIISVEKINDVLDKPVDNIQSLYYANDGKLWLGTNSGIYGIENNHSIIHFDRYNGLPDNDVNSIFIQSDTIWAGTVSGLSKIILNRVSKNDQFRTIITSLRYKTGNENHLMHLSDSFSVVHVCSLRSDASLIELDLAALDFSYRHNVRYVCIIKKSLPALHVVTLNNILTWLKSGFGVDFDTTQISGSTFNFGVYLAPGRYTIEIRAINPNSVASAIPEELIINKLPEWYQTIWFYLLMWLFLIGILWRVQRTVLDNRKLQTAISELRLQAIQLQINPHFIGNSINAIQQFFFPPDPFRASEYIAIFTRLLRTTMDFSEKPFVPLKDELAYNEDYLRMIHLRFGNRFHYFIDIGEGVGMEMPFPTMLLQPILENATIHGLSPFGTSILEIEMSKRTDGLLICTVTDNGLGVHHSEHMKKQKASTHQSKGLLLLEKKIKTLNELYKLGCTLVVNDLSDKDPKQHGTQVILSFFSVRV